MLLRGGSDGSRLDGGEGSLLVWKVSGFWWRGGTVSGEMSVGDRIFGL